MLSLAAYADRLSLRPGETIRFHAASTTGAPVTSSLVRVISADANPKGPGVVTEAVDSETVALAPPGAERVPSGSYMIVDALDEVLSTGPFTFACRVYPTRLDANLEQQVLCSREGRDGGGGFTLSIGADGALNGSAGDAEEAPLCTTARALMARRWSLVWIAYDGATLSVGHAPLDTAMLSNTDPATASQTFGDGAPGHGPLLMGAANPAQPRAHFNGKLEAPMLFARALNAAELEALRAGRSVDDPIAAWDLSKEVATSRIVDTGPSARHGRTVNTPVRAVTGSTWTGHEMCFRHAPAEYGAIHFHDDDIDDCHWPACFEWTVPQGTRSGVYALMLESGDARENVPFHVVPAKGEPRAKLAVLASTVTYTIYANHARPDWDTDPNWRKAWKRQVREWGCYPDNPAEHPEYGLSTYNFHSDGSGISIASWNRPMLNVSVGYLTYPDEPIRASGLRHFPADSHLIGWLEAKGIEYDLITDWELHHEGMEVLGDYQVLLTGSHPEYHTPQMLDALTQFRNAGGRFAYLGGNGFYWKVAFDPEKDGVIEIRRGEGGIRAWAAEPGEYYNQFDGEYGGLWRRNGRAPQDLTGVGFTAQGSFSGSYYRKRPEASDPRVAWMFEGVDDDVFGDHGFSAHGAAGFELDRADKLLGTPVHAVVVASSENHPPEAPWILVPEEMLTHLTTLPGTPADQLIRADMTFFETPAGGAVFSTGSITFCGSLVTNDFDNDVSQLIENVVNRFLDPTAFEMPEGA